jgi:hypothetical protein
MLEVWKAKIIWQTMVSSSSHLMRSTSHRKRVECTEYSIRHAILLLSSYYSDNDIRVENEIQGGRVSNNINVESQKRDEDAYSPSSL